MSSNGLRFRIDVLDFIRAHRRVRTSDVVQEFGLDSPTEYKRVRRAILALEQAGVLVRNEAGGTTTYSAATPQPGSQSSTEAELIALILSAETLAFLSGSEVDDWVQQALGRALADASPGARRRAEVFQSRFRTLSEPARSFSGSADHLNAILFALCRNRCLSLREDGEDHRQLEPLALVLYRRALYLLARVPGQTGTQRIAVDRIGEARTLPATFEYPRDFDLAAELDPWFGIRRGEAVARVVLRFRPRVAQYVLARCWHHTAIAEPLDDGGVQLSMQTGGEELVRWVLEWGETVQVLEPQWLRDQVAGELRAALAQYPTTEAPPTPDPSEATA